jgi:NAD(P)-dependent dehydrogenase (short-subunit alcohol dehydrogenase family)
MNNRQTSWSFDGAVVIVTGGSSGIGRATAVALAGSGANVVIVGRTAPRVADVRAQVDGIGGPGTALGLLLDVRREQDMHEMVQRCIEHFGRIDALVTCAGVATARPEGRALPDPFPRIGLEEWETVIGTNLRGVFLSNRAVLPTMIAQRRGAIINVSSARAGRVGSAYASVYSASKFGVVGLSEALAKEVGQFGVRVHVIYPDVTDTRMLVVAGGTARYSQALPPARVADVIVHLLSLPDDVILRNVVVAPFARPPRQTTWQS